MMNENKKIFVAEASGIVGSTIVRKLLTLGYDNMIGSYHTRSTIEDYFARSVKLEMFDLTAQDTVNRYFFKKKPDCVFLAATSVCGPH